MIRFLSIGRKGRAVGLDPEAMMMFLPVICSDFPSLLVIFIVFLSTKEPMPTKLSILFFLNRNAIPATFCAMTSSRSEEHTSELQSLMRISYAVFCLKKKNNTKTNNEIDIPLQTRHTNYQ